MRGIAMGRFTNFLGEKTGLLNQAQAQTAAAKTLEAGVVKLGGLAPVIVVLLRSYTIDMIFTILKKIPGLGLLAIAGKVLLRSTLESFSLALNEKGEPYLMALISEVWLNKNMQRVDLECSINKIPDMAVPAHIKSEAIQLLDKYYPKADEIKD